MTPTTPNLEDANRFPPKNWEKEMAAGRPSKPYLVGRLTPFEKQSNSPHTAKRNSLHSWPMYGIKQSSLLPLGTSFWESFGAWCSESPVDGVYSPTCSSPCQTPAATNSSSLISMRQTNWPTGNNLHMIWLVVQHASQRSSRRRPVTSVLVTPPLLALVEFGSLPIVLPATLRHIPQSFGVALSRMPSGHWFRVLPTRTAPSPTTTWNWLPR